EGVEAAEGVDRLTHEALGAAPVADVVGIDDGLATGAADRRHDLLGGARRGAAAVARATQVVHDHARALRRQAQRVLASDAPACSRHDRDPSCAELGHATAYLDPPP